MKEDKIRLKKIKIGLLCDNCVGKTSICYALLNLGFTKEILSTTVTNRIETEYPLNNGNVIKLILLDIAGYERFRSIELRNIKRAHGLILMMDFTNYRSFENLDSWLKQISDNFEKKIPIVLFGNQVDIPKEKWEITDEQVKEFAKKNNLTYFKTSAKTRQGVKEGFSYIVNESYKRLEENNEHIIIESENNNIKIREKNSKKDNCTGKKEKK